MSFFFMLMRHLQHKYLVHHGEEFMQYQCLWKCLFSDRFILAKYLNLWHQSGMNEKQNLLVSYEYDIKERKGDKRDIPIHS